MVFSVLVLPSIDDPLPYWGQQQLYALRAHLLYATFSQRESFEPTLFLKVAWSIRTLQPYYYYYPRIYTQAANSEIPPSQFLHTQAANTTPDLYQAEVPPNPQSLSSNPAP